MENYQNIIEQLGTSLNNIEDPGKVATYIPELGKIEPNKFGVCLTTIDHHTFAWGDAHEKLSIQSIAKVFALVLAYQITGEALWERVGVEPSGDPFNSMVQLEYEHGIPRNPLINAGAIVVCDVLMGHFSNPKKAILNFIRRLTDDDQIHYNERIAQSEKETGFRNAALVNMMKSFGNIKHDVKEVLDVYFHLSAIELTCQELSRASLFLANDGVDPISNVTVISPSNSKRINAIMQLCGFYDEAGEFAFKVGLPGKSGVGGGILAVLPGHYAISTWSPRLNSKGNSFKGVAFLEAFTTATATSIF